MSAATDVEVREAEPARERVERLPRRLARAFLGPQGGLLLVILAIVLLTELKSPVMLASSNLIEVLRATVVYFVGACAATLVIVGGGLDLSIGAMVAAGGVAVGELMNHGVPWPLAILGTLVLAAGVGALNAALVLKVLVPPFVTTLGMYFILLGLINVVTGGTPLYDFPAAFAEIGAGDALGVPYLVFYGLAIGAIFHVVLSYTPFGYDVKAVGGNRLAALGNGVRVTRVTATTYVIGGIMTAVAGVLLAARNAAADPAVGGASYTFQVFSAVIIGGTSLFGGIGSIYGTALGCLLFSVLDNALALFEVNTLWLNTVTGVVLIVAVAIDQARRRRQFRAGLR